MILLLLSTSAILGIILFLQHPQFGALPTGKRLERVQSSENYKNGAFRNVEHTSVMQHGTNYLELLKYVLFTPNIRTRPAVALPSLKVQLHNLDRSEDLLVWFGHSSYYLQTDGLRILVDPVFNGTVSPLGFSNRSFAGSDVVGPDDIPDLDLLILTHDHWDHLEHSTVKSLLPRSAKVITSLGVGAHLERWGCPADRLVELDWWQSTDIAEGISITAAPGRHFSGRLIKRAQSLWSGFALHTPSRQLYLGGDSGYGQHFKQIGERLGPFDLALLECGQYDSHWINIHMMPEHTVQAALDLKTKRLMPVHWSKFVLAKHPWDDSIRRVSKAASTAKLPLLHPRIGEVVSLSNPHSEQWWDTPELRA